MWAIMSSVARQELEQITQIYSTDLTLKVYNIKYALKSEGLLKDSCIMGNVGCSL